MEAGAGASTGTTVSQSGISKRLDQAAGNDLLSKIAAMLGRAEKQIAELALLVLGNGVPPADLAPIRVHYPTQFDLFTAEELARTITQFQAILAVAGHAPETESELLRKLVRLMLPGLQDEEYAGFDAEIEHYLDTRAAGLGHSPGGIAGPAPDTFENGAEP